MSEMVINGNAIEYNEPTDPSLFVDLDLMAEDSGILVAQAKIINDNAYDIKKLLSEGWESWIGSDKDEYVKSLKKEVADNLIKVAHEVNKIGEFMSRIQGKYATQVTRAVEGLENNE